jgi:hypothetical protein
MKALSRSLVLAALFLLALTPVWAQQNQEQVDESTLPDMSGEWQAFRVDVLSTYSISEHRLSQDADTQPSGMLTLNQDGEVETDIEGVNFRNWGTHKDFLLFETPGGNVFYRPRQLSETAFFLVQVDVVERNSQIISITARPRGNLIVIRP